MIRFLQTPGRLQKVLLVGFLAVICVMMVVTLVPGGMFLNFGGSSLSANALAKVDGREITLDEVNQTASNLMQQRHIPPKFKSMILPQALDALVLRRVYLSEADRLGLRATDDDLRYEMQNGPLAKVLYPGGKFIGDAAYRNLVISKFDLTVPQFESELRNDLTMQRIRTVLGAGVSVSDAEVHAAFVKERTRVQFRYAVLTADQLAKSVQVKDAELHAYYQKNQQQFANTLPEQRKLNYVVVDPDRLPHPAQPDLAALTSYYRQHSDEYRVAEAVMFRHILIKLPLPGANGQVDAKKAAAARAKAEMVLGELRKGADFAALARKYSDDVATASKGGVVGKLVEGSGSAPEIEKVAFSLPVGKVSDVIPTSYGFEIIRVDKKIAARQRSFDEVRSQIEPLVAAQENQALASRLARKVESAAKTGSLEKAAAANGLTMQQSAFVTRTDALPGIGTSSQFSSAVFGMSLKAAPATVPLASGYAIVQVTAIQPPSTPSFDQVKDRITTELRQQKAQALLTTKLQELSDKARASHNLAEAAQAVGATMKTSQLVSPNGQVPDIGQLASSAPQIFQMKPGDVSGPINFGEKGVVIQLTDKYLPSKNEYELEKKAIRNSLLQQKRAEADEIFALSARDRLQKEGRLYIDAKKLKDLSAANDE